MFGVQDEKLFIEISQKRLAQLGLDFNQVLAQLGQQNAVESRRRDADAAGRGAGARGRPVRGASSSCARCRSAAARATSCALGDIAEIKRGYVDPPG